LKLHIIAAKAYFSPTLLTKPSNLRDELKFLFGDYLFESKPQTIKELSEQVLNNQNYSFQAHIRELSNYKFKQRKKLIINQTKLIRNGHYIGIVEPIYSKGRLKRYKNNSEILSHSVCVWSSGFITIEEKSTIEVSTTGNIYHEINNLITKSRESLKFLTKDLVIDVIKSIFFKEVDLSIFVDSTNIHTLIIAPGLEKNQINKILTEMNSSDFIINNRIKSNQIWEYRKNWQRMLVLLHGPNLLIEYTKKSSVNLKILNIILHDLDPKNYTDQFDKDSVIILRSESRDFIRDILNRRNKFKRYTHLIRDNINLFITPGSEFTDFLWKYGNKRTELIKNYFEVLPTVTFIPQLNEKERILLDFFVEIFHLQWKNGDPRYFEVKRSYKNFPIVTFTKDKINLSSSKAGWLSVRQIRDSINNFSHFYYPKFNPTKNNKEINFRVNDEFVPSPGILINGLLGRQLLIQKELKNQTRYKINLGSQLVLYYHSINW
jgi:hypothetical protein